MEPGDLLIQAASTLIGAGVSAVAVIAAIKNDLSWIKMIIEHLDKRVTYLEQQGSRQ